MMDGITTAASLLRMGTAGRQIAINLYILATQLTTDAEDRISALSNDVSFTAGVLQQLGELIRQTRVDGGRTGFLLSRSGLDATRSSASVCETIFNEIERGARDASERLRGRRGRRLGKIRLSGSERAEWTFLQPSVEALRDELRGARGTSMLVLQVTSFALSSKKMANGQQAAPTLMVEQRDIVRAILELSKQAHSSDESLAKTSTLCSYHSSTQEPTLSTSNNPYALKYSGHDAIVETPQVQSRTAAASMSAPLETQVELRTETGKKTAAPIKQAVGVAETTPERPRISNRIAQRHFREQMKTILDDLARKRSFIEGLAGVNHIEDENEDERDDWDWTQTVEGHAALESMQGDGTLEGFDFDAFLRDSAPDANKPTDASGAPGASVAPPPVSQMNVTDVETKQCTREDKNDEDNTDTVSPLFGTEKPRLWPESEYQKASMADPSGDDGEPQQPMYFSDDSYDLVSRLDDSDGSDEDGKWDVDGGHEEAEAERIVRDLIEKYTTLTLE
ncbi:hypothetical protein XANCAGTX0491_000316 [Xanthoria calcicola]